MSDKFSSLAPERMVKLRLSNGDFIWWAERRWRMFLKRLEDRS